MKKIIPIFLLSIFSFILLSFNGCDPFESRYITLSIDTELNTFGTGPNISITSDLCLSDEDDYEDNKDEIEEIKYVAAAYTTISASNGLTGTNLTLRVFQSDGVTLLFDYVIPTFVAANYINNPLKIELTQQEINNINEYLKNHQQNDCFRAELTVTNAGDSDGPPFFITGKIQFLTEIKLK